MAIISSYPISIPQLADKIIGTNATDAYGNPVVNNPTSQYTFSSVKTLIDQHYIQRMSTSNELAIVPGIDNAGIPIIFGASDITTLDVAYIASTGTITFRTLGSYCIQQLYYAQATSGNNIQLNFKTLQAYIDGELVFSKGISKIKSVPFKILNNFNTNKKSISDFRVESNAKQIEQRSSVQ